MPPFAKEGLITDTSPETMTSVEDRRKLAFQPVERVEKRELFTIGPRGGPALDVLIFAASVTISVAVALAVPVDVADYLASFYS